MSKPAVFVLLALLLLPASALAKAPSPLGGPYLFFGGGVGLQTTADTDGIAVTPRWGPTLELGGDLGPLNAAIGADMRILVKDFGPVAVLKNEAGTTRLQKRISSILTHTVL